MKKNCPTKALAPRKEENKGKGKAHDERKLINDTWKRKEANGTRNESKVTSSSGSSDHTTST